RYHTVCLTSANELFTWGIFACLRSPFICFLQVKELKGLWDIKALITRMNSHSFGHVKFQQCSLITLLILLLVHITQQHWLTAETCYVSVSERLIRGILSYSSTENLRLVN